MSDMLSDSQFDEHLAELWRTARDDTDRDHHRDMIAAHHYAMRSRMDAMYATLDALRARVEELEAENSNLQRVNLDEHSHFEMLMTDFKEQAARVKYLVAQLATLTAEREAALQRAEAAEAQVATWRGLAEEASRAIKGNTGFDRAECEAWITRLAAAKEEK